MNDIERRLRDLGERVREEQESSPLRERSLRAAKRRRLGTALTGTVTVVALAFGATFAAGAFTSETSKIGPAQHRSEPCGPPVDFKPTYLPEGWVEDLQPASGGGAAWEIVGHYGNEAPPSTTEKAAAGFAELFAGESPYPLERGEEIRVLDEAARFGPIHEGFSVEFTQHGCDYALLGFGIPGEELRRFAKGLRLPGTYLPAEPSDAEGFAAIWPEDSEERAGEECTSIQHVDGHWRSDGIRTAERFATEVLGWETAQAMQSKPERGLSVYVGNGPISIDTPMVIVHVNELFGGCWSVVSVAPDEEPEDDGSMTVRGRDVRMGFDLGDAASAIFEVGYAGQTTRYVWEGDNSAVSFTLDFEPRGTGHFLVLLVDGNGDVFSAFGSPLPEGDFSAG